MAPAAFGRERESAAAAAKAATPPRSFSPKEFAPAPDAPLLIPVGPRRRWPALDEVDVASSEEARATIAAERRRRGHARARIAKGDRAAIVAFVALVAPDDKIFPRRTTTNGDGRDAAHVRAMVSTLTRARCDATRAVGPHAELWTKTATGRGVAARVGV